MKLQAELIGEYLNPDVPDEDLPALAEEALVAALLGLPGLRPGFKIRIADTRPTRCANCNTVHLQQELLPLDQAPDLGERLTPGDEVPAGECPKCRAFCYFIKPT